MAELVVLLLELEPLVVPDQNPGRFLPEQQLEQQPIFIYIIKLYVINLVFIYFFI